MLGFDEIHSPHIMWCGPFGAFAMLERATGGLTLNTFKITPTVNQAKEFMEIASDFGQPLELLREAISNAFDAKASRIKLLFSTEVVKGIHVLKILIEDNGTGMDLESLQAFFDLGNSPRHREKIAAAAEGARTWPIGEKGHGTKVYFNSAKITVSTHRGNRTYEAVLNEPYGMLSDGKIPEVTVEERDEPAPQEYSTRIIVEGYNHNQTELFNHDRLRDYIYWFTKFGSSEVLFGIKELALTEIQLKGLDRQTPEILRFGHPFAPESPSLQALFDTYDERAGDYFCKRYTFRGTLPKLPQFPYEAIFSVEGNRTKLDSNKMLKRPGKYVAPQGAYTVAERYGIWLCKDFIPVERRNEVVSYKGSEYTKLHAFFNCQALRLSANRGSVEPTPEVIKNAVNEEIRRIYDQIMSGEDMEMLDYLEEEASVRRTIDQEAKDFKKRQERSDKAQVAEHKGALLIEPYSEVGVLAMMAQVVLLEPALLPFTILDYDSHSGYDLLVKGDATTPIQNARKFYVEYKYVLTGAFNHSFQNLRSIVCWNTKLQQDDEVQDIAQKKRVLKIQPPQNPKAPDAYTRYFLDDPHSPIRIELIVLKLYLKERLQLEFKPRDLSRTA